MKKLCILGSTGSIGTQTLEIVRQFPEDFEVVAMSCGHNTQLFAQQLREFRPMLAAVADEHDAQLLAADFPATEFFWGTNGISAMASACDADMVVNALLGMMGIQPTFEAIKSGKDIAFANKETLVAGGKFIMSAVKDMNVAFLPVDSEHSAIFQSLQGAAGNKIKKLILTASGGPFRGYTYEQLKTVTKAQALKHPNWTMGAKITIDSASMMNKGLEIIEASWLFDMKANDIEVVVHPQSALHSAIEFEDGAIIGQMGSPDMKLPIAYALTYPKRIPVECKPFSLGDLGTMTFEKPDINAFRCLGLAYESIKKGGSYPAVLNAANEEAVAAFLQDRITFTGIAEVVEHCLNKYNGKEVMDLDELFALEDQTRRQAKAYLRQIG